MPSRKPGPEVKQKNTRQADKTYELRKEGEDLLPGVTWQADAYVAASDAEAVIILTEWNEFRALDLEELSKVMKDPRMADLRNIYRPADAENAGFRYVSVGR